MDSSFWKENGKVFHNPLKPNVNVINDKHTKAYTPCYLNISSFESESISLDNDDRS